MDPLTQLDEILPLLNGLVAGLDPEQLDAPTPCTDYAVRDVLAHMVGGATMFAAGFRGGAPGEPDTSDLVAAFPKAMAELRDAAGSEGALERTIDSPFGQMPGEAFARLVAVDGIVHGWDIATAVGQVYEPSPELVAAVDGFARAAIREGARAGGAFGPEVEPPAGATPIERLAAFTGRRV